MSPPGAERSECEKPCWYIFFSMPRKRVTGLAKEVQRTSGFIPIKTVPWLRLTVNTALRGK